MLRKLLFFSFIFLVFISKAGFSEDNLIIRVLIAQNISSFYIYAKDLKISSEDALLKDNLEHVKIFAQNSSIYINKKPIKVSKILLSSSDYIWINKKAYKGNIRIILNSKSKLDAVNTLPFEEYISGTVAGEMPSKWPIEALKAQAITARSYAYYALMQKKNVAKNYDIRSTIHDQVYEGGHIPQKITDAVKATKGMIISFRGKPVKARFHSTCGGQTETSDHVWGENDVHKSISDPFCKASPHRNWNQKMTSIQIASRLKKSGFNTGKIKSIQLEKFDNNRVAAVSIHGTNETLSLTSNDFRKYMGFSQIKSTDFTTQKNGNDFVFAGHGFGHGVGMCQWGAKGMAENGYSYIDIIKYYYPRTVIGKTTD